MQPAARTLEHLLDIVPQVLNFQTKLDLYRRLRDAHRAKETVTIRVSTTDDLRLIEEVVHRIVERAKAQPLPPSVESRLTWFSRGDGLVARRLTAEVEVQEGALVANYLQEELSNLAALLRQSNVAPYTRHEVSLPCGTIIVEFTHKRQWRWHMTEKSDTARANLPARREESMLARPAGDIIDQALRQMVGPDESQEIVTAAQHEALRLAAKQREGAMDSAVAKREMVEFLEQAHEASSLRDMEYEAEADFKRASGRTHVKVRSRRRWWWPFG